MRLMLASMLSLVAVSCSSSPKNNDEQATVPAVEAAAEPMEIAPEPDLSTPEKAVYQALLAAQIEDADEALAAYMRLVHPDVLESAEAVQQVRNDTWARFRNSYDLYVRSGSRADYIMVRRDPAVTEADTQEVRIWIRDLVNGDREPVEVHVKRLGKEWRIVSNPM